MNKIWLDRMRQHHQKMQYKKKPRFKKFIFWLGICCLIFLFFYPQYIKRIIYPYLLGKPSPEPMQISAEDFYEDISVQPIEFKRNNESYILEPKVYYKTTGRIGIVDNYDTLSNIIYRWHKQKEYINLVPRDLILVIGQMAKPEIFKQFEFMHEERVGYISCKGVKYRTSFMPIFMSREKAHENWERYNRCQQLIKDEERNNYHPIPANEIINRALSMLLPGDIVTLEGYLVDVPQMGLYTGTRKGQIHKKLKVGGMKSTMCFILYTTRVIINGRIYE